jgi:phosphinothricin acetyltransferase
MKIRPYTTLDTAIIVKILNYYIKNDTCLYDYQTRTTEKQHILFEEKIAKGFPVLVATINNKIVGFGYYSEFRLKEAYKYTVEHSVYVNSTDQGKGVGKLLLENLIALAKQQNLHTMIAVIDSENTNSILFHEKFGFSTVGIIKESGFKFNRWLHNTIMQLVLT